VKWHVFVCCWLIVAIPARAEPNFEIGGLIVDQTLSPIGHRFYEELTSGWEPARYDGSITVHERPDIFAGNIIWVEIDETIVFQERMGTRVTGIEEKAALARKQIETYLLFEQESLQGLEVY